ncbi:transcriptional regulator, PadR family [Fructobacillus pseudoficulneus]|uniref:Transcriptional regulator, PadR family n=1 Tax=Fructobacillus pseudoficulneus TaxID=220714 RepID=A0A3F3H2Y2_9LACO|nr:PadR family transcriptional regulator [Fructobacillus pseudoficulneus]GAP02878.1 transcriptional regulator, PadR family [Fructobacillus pseudoficulneus]SEH45477.1 PadR family transcriptional regulator, regulatory protein PadR [Fructobacillus pseudoficulneus]
MKIKIPNLVLEAVVLQTLSKEELYGYVITKQIQAVIPISDSTTYPILRRLEQKGYVTTRSAIFDERTRKYYCLTDEGRAHLTEAKAEWETFVEQVNEILGE